MDLPIELREKILYYLPDSEALQVRQIWCPECFYLLKSFPTEPIPDGVYPSKLSVDRIDNIPIDWFRYLTELNYYGTAPLIVFPTSLRILRIFELKYPMTTIRYRPELKVFSPNSFRRTTDNLSTIPEEIWNYVHTLTYSGPMTHSFPPNVISLKLIRYGAPLTRLITPTVKKLILDDCNLTIEDGDIPATVQFLVLRRGDVRIYPGAVSSFITYE